MDLLNMVAQPTWREILTQLVDSKKLDPWDVDLIEVSDAYLQTVRSFQSMDLRVPANIILACTILLKFKAQAIQFAPDVAEDAYDEPALLEAGDGSDLVFSPRAARPRKVTLEELIKAVDDVMKEGRRAPTRATVPAILNIELSGQEINERIEKVYSRACELKDSEGLLLFSALLQERNVETIPAHLLPVLHLVQDQRLAAWQDEFFGEIFIRVLERPEVSGRVDAAQGAAAVNAAGAVVAQSEGVESSVGTPGVSS